MKSRVINKDKELRIFLIVVGFLAGVILIFLVTGLRVAGRERDERIRRNEREAAENCFVMELRSYLNDQGLYNSGLSLTKVWENDKEYEYTVSIHNDRIQRGTDNLKEGIRRTVEELGEKLDCKEITVAFIE